MQVVLQIEGIEKVYQFLEEAHLYYLATVEGDQPRSACRRINQRFLTFQIYDAFSLLAGYIAHVQSSRLSLSKNFVKLICLTVLVE